MPPAPSFPTIRSWASVVPIMRSVCSDRGLAAGNRRENGDNVSLREPCLVFLKGMNISAVLQNIHGWFHLPVTVQYRSQESCTFGPQHLQECFDGRSLREREHKLFPQQFPEISECFHCDSHNTRSRNPDRPDPSSAGESPPLPAGRPRQTAGPRESNPCRSGI